MPAATPMHQRQEIVKRHQAGQSLAQIARDMQLSEATVRNIWRFFQQHHKLEPNYAACAKTEPRKAPAVYQQAIALKREHPRWGAGLIWVELAERFAESALPSERTLQRWFHRAGLVEVRNRTQVAQPALKRGEQAHEVWAVDAKEAIALGNGEVVSWLLISDEGSGAVLETRLFPHQALE